MDLDEEALIELIESTRDRLLEVYQIHPTFLHPLVIQYSTELDRLLDLYMHKTQTAPSHTPRGGT
ncbi:MULTISPECIES: aspartyl-phosphate phosphatase Spo0E family protein [unclassified Paenibacillus]|uniref:aspartyl-phosphate phosphatase Spo0E family protein n=1 Tax=unclassified Paenibacillus TaxID=185978 RepID=UPI000954DAB0|nr:MULTISPECIES: aspartyl-phosphate phosphatase Spo0E family protein [unclassified Paenibacillus]ASS66581.1 aspartyl-phosphate phosphatase Spo0E family protein [Paenibacillus sp. RUD330]SIQ01822.1 Spo0E like sporulation regulatory protein [Paenibacillus sp. RU4X]SIQ21195.1 Spo0E like sporulation regulatory protein [Paenibacillus sp. RU4T]